MYKIFAVQYREGCAERFCVPRLERIDDLAEHLKQHLGQTTCLVHYVRPLPDGSDEINGNRFVWTGHELVRR
jgi:hypothetical protein